MKADHDIIGRIRRIGEIGITEDTTVRAIDRARRAVLNAQASVRRKAANTTVIRFAASAFSIIAASILTVLFWETSSPSVAFAEVQARIAKTRSIELVESKWINGQLDEHSRAIILASGLTRINRPDGSYSIVDTRNRKSMAVSADGEQAVIWHELLPHVPANLYEYIKSLHTESPRELPSRTIDGTKVVGLAVTVRHDVLGTVIESKVSIWVNPKTNLPVRMEVMAGQEIETVLHEIRFDEPINESQFRFEPPAGSSVVEHGPAQPSPAAVQEVLAQIQASDRAAPNKDSKVVRLGQVLKLWDSGKKDDAVKQLGAIKWEDLASITDTPIMKISEKEFMSLAIADRTRLQAEALKFVGTAKELMRHAFSLGEKAQTSGDPQTAKEYYQSVQRLGTALSDPSRLLVLQLMGKGLVKQAEEKLDGMN